MRFEEFKDTNKFYSIVMFVQTDDVNRFRTDLEALGNYTNVRLIVQPCPYEGIEFLYRVAHQSIGQKVSMDKDIFWQSIEIKKGTAHDLIEKISNHQYEYLCAILEQDANKVEREGKVLQSLSEHFI